MRAYLRGVELEYGKLTWSELCDPRLLVVGDGVHVDMGEDAKAGAAQAVKSLTEFLKPSLFERMINRCQ